MDVTNSSSIRWSSSSTTKGSLKNYGRDFISKHSTSAQERAKRDVELEKEYNKATKRTTHTERPERGVERPSTASRRLNSVTVKKWTVDDVLLWLSDLGLETYAQVFSRNEISGECSAVPIVQPNLIDCII